LLVYKPMKILLSLILISLCAHLLASGIKNKVKTQMTFEEYIVKVEGTATTFESREQFYRFFHLFFQVIAVVSSASIPILLNAHIEEKRKKRIITILSLSIVITVSSSGVFKFREQSDIYGEGAILLRENIRDYATDMGAYKELKNDSILKTKTYRYLADKVITDTRRGIKAQLPKETVNIPN